MLIIGEAFGVQGLFCRPSRTTAHAKLSGLLLCFRIALGLPRSEEIILHSLGERHSFECCYLLSLCDFFLAKALRVQDCFFAGERCGFCRLVLLLRGDYLLRSLLAFILVTLNACEELFISLFQGSNAGVLLFWRFIFRRSASLLGKKVFFKLFFDFLCFDVFRSDSYFSLF